MIRILVASHQLTLQITLLPFERVNSPNFELVGIATDSVQLFELCTQVWPDVLILDANLPADGLDEVVVNIKQIHHCLRILVIQHCDTSLGMLITNGIDGLIHQSEYLYNIENAIHVLSLGGFWFSKPLLQHLFQAPIEIQNEGCCDLTKRELEVLKVLSEGSTNKKIAQTLGVKERTIEFHVSNILSKLQTTSRVTAALWAKSHKLNFK